MKNNIKFPVALFLYKRTEHLENILSLIINSGTQHIYIFSDGQKDSSDKQLVEKVRKIVNKVKKNHRKIKFSLFYSSKNLGLQQNIVTGLNQVFNKEKAVMVLEDDCIPHPDFFTFATRMLKKYEKETKVMSITGTSVANFHDVSKYSYDFSKYELCWGWATWKRAWDLYDDEMSGLDGKKWEAKASKLWHNFLMRFYWKTMLHLTKVGQVKSWAFRWSYAHFKHGGKVIVPSVNLISNVGFDSSATNTKLRSRASFGAIKKISFPLKHPKYIKVNNNLDKSIEHFHYYNSIALLGMTRQILYKYLSSL